MSREKRRKTQRRVKEEQKYILGEKNLAGGKVSVLFVKLLSMELAIYEITNGGSRAR